MTDREMRKYQEELLFENFLTKEMLEAKKQDALIRYLSVSSARTKSGMTAEEIEAIAKRAKDSAEAL